MLEVVLSFPSPEGSQEIAITRDRTTIGRGSDVDHRFDDDGMSRLNSSIYREGDSVWIVDENSANGTFINGQPAGASGTVLRGGDSIKLGNRTVLTVHVREEQAFAASSFTAPDTPVHAARPAASGGASIGFLPLALIALAFMVVSVSGAFVAYQVFARAGADVAENDGLDDPIDDVPVKEKTPSPTPSSSAKPGNSSSNSGGDLPVNSGPTSTTPTVAGYNMPAGKKYLDLSDSEKRQYLSDRAMKIAQAIGNSSSEQIPSEALDKIKGFADGYAKRVNTKPLGGCRFGDNLQVTYERASKNAHFIVKAFNEKSTDPRIGLYLAMIESEHCVCLQSPTGPLGMFQFTKSTGELHGLKTKPGASPSNPDERCEPEPAARAAASYMKALTGRYGTGPSSVPLAIGSYNSGEGGLSSNLAKALESDSGLPRDFWTLIANGEKLSKQFQAENFKYVPKFFAAAIIGENPTDFGLNLRPLSTYSN